MTVNVAEIADRFDELVSLVEAGTPVSVESGGRRITLIADEAAPTEGTPYPRREWKRGLNPGAMVMTDDFDAPYTEEKFLRGDI